MKKLEKALIAVVLSSTLFATGVSFAQQDRNQNGNGNSNLSNRNSNGTANSGSMSGSSNATMSGSTSSSMSMGSGMMNGMIGNVTIEEFQRVNQQSGAAVAAITPSNTPLSKGDQKLMMEVAMGGLMQLEVSRAALSKVTSEQARTLAQAEVEEQTGLAAKLREIAAAKNVTLPSAPDSKTTSMIAKMSSAAAGMDFDKMYIRESGVKGHQKLDKTMTKVESSGTDDNLKALATAAHPNVRLHLQVSQAELDKMGGKGSSGNSTGNSNRSGGSTGSGSNSNSNR